MTPQNWGAKGRNSEENYPINWEKPAKIPGQTVQDKDKFIISL